jgi:transposase
VKASGTTLTEIFGVGPVVAAIVLGEAEDVARFRDRGRFAAYNGTAPIEVSSGRRTVHRLSRRGNRRVNHAIHMAAITQIRYAHSEGRAYYDKKVAEGKTSKEALRALKRRISDALFRRLRADASGAAAESAHVTGPGGQAGNDTDAGAAGSHPGCRLFGEATPGPEPTLRPAPVAQPENRSSRASKRDPEPLDTKIWMALRAVAGVMRMGRACGPLTPVPFGCARPSQRLALELSFRVSPVASRTRVSVS